jgi:hypothetical protein
VKLSSTLLGIVLPSVLIITLSCSKESFAPPPSIDPETRLSVDGSDPPPTKTDSLDARDTPGDIDFINPDRPRDDETPPPTFAQPETVLERLEEA